MGTALQILTSPIQLSPHPPADYPLPERTHELLYDAAPEGDAAHQRVV